MIKPQILYGVMCDRCGTTLINDNDNAAWWDRFQAEDEASEADWHSVSDHHYCPNCYREDDDGNRIIKAPFPEYVKGIRLFLNRLANSFPVDLDEEDNYVRLVGHTKGGKALDPRDIEWIKAYAGDKLIDIRIVEDCGGNAKYAVKLCKE
ncbi:MAG: hypothetical protein NC226_09695 [Bacteroides cellulosilyticus]|nr:hypothetical protein [Bacteroides cellulosilyticus]